MTKRSIDLDDRRTARGKIESELRRKVVNRDKSPDMRLIVSDIGIDAALTAELARTWIEAMEKAAFLLRRYAATSETSSAGDTCARKRPR